MVDISLTNATVFPEDQGTGAPVGEEEGDFVSAGHLGTLTLNRASNSFVESGAEFTFNADNTLLTVSKTLAFIRFEGDIQVQNGQGEYEQPWNYPMMFMVVFPTEDSIPVTAGGVNNIYLWIDRGEEDGAYLRVGQNVATPDGPSVQLGSVDPRDGTTSKTNRGETGGITDADILDAVNTDADHGTTAPHNYTTSTDLEQGGSDELDVTGLVGDLADPQESKPHDHSGDALVPNSVTADSASFEITNGVVVSANEQDGTELGEKVTNARTSLPNGNGVITIFPKEDGTPWQWTSDQVINTSIHRHIEIRCAPGVEIEYTGTGSPLTFTNPDGLKAGTTILNGGTWRSTGTDPDGCITVQGVSRPQLRPHHIDEFSNTTNTGHGIQFQNVDRFVEGWRVEGSKITGCDIGIDFKPGWDVGNSGVNSMVDGTIKDVNISASVFGIHFRGQFASSVIQNVACFAGAPDAIGINLNGALPNVVFMGCRFDNVAQHANYVGISTGQYYGLNNPTANPNAPPIFVGPFFAYTVQTNITRNDPTHSVSAIESLDNGLGVGDMGSSLVFGDNGVEFEGQNLTVTSGRVGEVAYHQPSIGGDTNPEGPYVFRAGGQWTSLVDGTKITPS